MFEALPFGLSKSVLRREQAPFSPASRSRAIMLFLINLRSENTTASARTESSSGPRGRPMHAPSSTRATGLQRNENTGQLTMRT